jgi:hypothetical protein
MHSPASFPQTSKSLRIATLLLAAALWIGASLQTARASDSLTTSSTDSTTTRTSLLKSLLGFKSSSSSSSSSTSSSSTTSASQVNRSILGLPIGILKAVASGVSKAAGSAVTKHITHN